MATHDYVIDNSTGANVRADINSVLQAILTNNSSSSAPSTTAAYMWWADTTNGVLKIRNSADNAWVELLQLDGTLTLEDGSASTPALAFRDDLNTGIFSSGANVFDIATGGVSRLQIDTSEITFNESGEDTDFRIEGDSQANLFKLDAGNDRIGVAIAAPRARFDLGNIVTDTAALTRVADRYQLVLEATDSSSRFSNNIGFILSGGTTVVAAINTFENGGNGSTGLSFATSSNSGSDPNEVMRFLADGSVRIGCTAQPSTTVSGAQFDTGGKTLRISEGGGTSSTTGASVQITGGGSSTSIGAAAAMGAILTLQNCNNTNNNQNSIDFMASTGLSTSKVIGKNDSHSSRNGSLIFATSSAAAPVERVRIDSSGRMFLGLTTTGYPKKLNVQGESGAIIHLNNYDTTTYAADTSTAIEFNVNTGNTGNQTGACEMRAFKENGTNGNNARGLSFYTGGNGASPAERLRIDSEGNVLIGTTSSNAKLHVFESADLNEDNPHIQVNGNGYRTILFMDATASHFGQTSTQRALRFYSGAETAGAQLSGSATSFTTYSDERLKENIKDIGSVLDKISDIRCVSYLRKDIKDFKETIGFIAQDFIDKFDQVLDSGKVKASDTEEHLGIKYTETIPILLKAIQELSDKVAALESA
tara:strand:- start:247 stop:2190 length:1944 start_codon:yes stop_codon:yes gene_type:complete